MRALSSELFEESTGSNVRVKKVGAEYVAFLGNGTREFYAGTGRLLRVQQPDGQVISLNYNANGMLESAVHSTGRSIEFRYGGNPRRLIGIDSEGSALVDYTYINGRLDSAIYAGGMSGKTYLYENATFPNHLTGIEDEKSVRFATYGYDDLGRAILTEHAGGAGRVSLTFEEDGTTTLVTPLNETKIYSFSNDGYYRKLTGVEGAGLPQVFERMPYGSDFRRRVESSSDARGFLTTYQYVDSGPVRKEIRTEALGTTDERTIETDFDLNSGRIASERSAETQSRFIYNERGQIIAHCEIDELIDGASGYVCGALVDAPDGVRQWTYEYCDIIAEGCPVVGLLKSTNGPRRTNDAGMSGLDDVTTFSYRSEQDFSCASNGPCVYRKGDLWKVTNALGQVTETVMYDKNGRPTRIKDANGTLTDLVYHPRGWLADRKVRANSDGTPSGGDAITHIDYEPTGVVSRVTQPDGAYLDYTYDDAHRLIKITDNLNNAIDYCPGGVGSADCLDAAGNRLVEQTKDSGGTIKRSLRRTYNQLSQLTAMLNASGQTTLSYPATDGYDANGNATNLVDGLGVKTQQDYDPLNRLKTTIQDYLGTDAETGNASTGYVYDARDNLRTVTDPDGLATNYDYDGLNNLTGLHSPDTGDTAYTHDLAGNRITQTDARYVTNTYTYDALNRLIATTGVTFAYDQSDATTGCVGSYPQGRLTQMNDESGQTTYCYDRRGNVVRKMQSGESGVLEVAYSYTLADHIQSMTYPSGAIVTYTRDSVGRITGVTRKENASATPVTIVSSASYYPFGPLNVLTYGNGRTLTKSYDTDYAIDKVVSSDPGGLLIDFTTSVMGNIVDASDSIAPTTKTRKYLYDHLYRLTRVNDGNDVLVEDYAYTPTGDRTLKQLGTQAPQVYAYLAGTHRLGSVAGVARSYDANGNTLDRGDGYGFIYNERNRRSLVTLPSAPNKVGEGGIKAGGGPQNQLFNRYNGRGERTASGNTLSYTNSAYVYDEAGHHLGAYVGNDTAAGEEVIYLDDLPIAITISGNLSYLETDHLGSPRIAANPATNARQWKWDFFGDAFGGNEPEVAATGGIDVRLRYPGQYADGFGINYNYFRDYEAGTGRYIESDPIGLMGGPSTFGFAYGNALRYKDPKGLDGEDYLSCWVRQATTGEWLGCNQQIVRDAEASKEWQTFSKACSRTVEGLKCVTVCALAEFVGLDVHDFLINLYKHVILQALERSAKKMAVTWLERGMPVVGQIDTLYDGYKTIRCSTTCVKY